VKRLDVADDGRDERIALHGRSRLAGHARPPPRWSLLVGRETGGQGSFAQHLVDDGLDRKFCRYDVLSERQQRLEEVDAQQ
jgi:hypothetical protein